MTWLSIFPLLALLALPWPFGSLTPHDQVQSQTPHDQVQELAVLPQPPVLTADYLLDFAARRYLPAGSEVSKETRNWFFCGTPILQFRHAEGDRLVEEAELVRRAHWLIDLVEPGDAQRLHDEVPRKCRTPGCSGKVSLAEATKIVIEEVPMPAPDIVPRRGR